jgi:hypothetical protein
MPAGDAPPTFVILYERVALRAKKFMVAQNHRDPDTARVLLEYRSEVEWAWR